MWREELDFVVEIKVTFRRATPPAASLIANRHSVPGEAIKLIEVCQTLNHKRTSCFFVGQIVFCHRRGAFAHHSSSPRFPEHATNSDTSPKVATPSQTIPTAGTAPGCMSPTAHTATQTTSPTPKKTTQQGSPVTPVANYSNQTVPG